MLVVLASCRDAPSAPGAGPSPVPSPIPSPVPSATVPPERPITDGSLAVGNLHAQITTYEGMARTRTPPVPERVAHVDLLLMRAQYLGQIADLEQATKLADDLVRAAPDDGRAHVARARVRYGWHRFVDALADLEVADREDAGSAAADGARAAILQATSRYDEALALRRELSAAKADILTLGAEGAVLADRGDLEGAAERFAAARRSYRDPSPFPVAWLRFLEGSMWLREDDLAKARPLLQEAVDRLPGYAPASAKLAQLDALEGRRDKALTRLRLIAERSDDPDYAAQLARLLGEAGQAEEAARWRRRAATRFDELLAVHPEAFAEPAADFWLNAGGDAKRALKLARQNVAGGATPRAYELLLQAALANGDEALACEAADGASRTPHQWPRLRALMTQAYRACGRVERQG